MNKISRNMNIILGTALIFALFLTWLGPIVIKILFTPPVSFGTNCEPAAAWSMSKLIWTQMIGLVLGALSSAIYIATRKSKSPAETPAANPK